MCLQWGKYSYPIWTAAWSATIYFTIAYTAIPSIALVATAADPQTNLNAESLTEESFVVIASPNYGCSLNQSNFTWISIGY